MDDWEVIPFCSRYCLVGYFPVAGDEVGFSDASSSKNIEYVEKLIAVRPPFKISLESL